MRQQQYLDAAAEYAIELAQSIRDAFCEQGIEIHAGIQATSVGRDGDITVTAGDREFRAKHGASSSISLSDLVAVRGARCHDGCAADTAT